MRQFLTHGSVEGAGGSAGAYSDPWKVWRLATLWGRQARWSRRENWSGCDASFEPLDGAAVALDCRCEVVRAISHGILGCTA